MSTESPDLSQKKHKSKKSSKKDKDPDQSSKKRQREEPSTTTTPALSSQVLVPDSQPSPKKQKKDKNKNRDGDATTTTSSSSHPFSDSLLESQTPFLQQTTSLYLPLSPCAYKNPIQGACAEHLSPLLLTYSSVLRGVVLAYDSPQLSEEPPEINKSSRNTIKGSTLAKTNGQISSGAALPTTASQHTSDLSSAAVLAESINEYGTSFLWLTANFLLFRPHKGTFLEGYVTMQNESMIGLLCYNFFRAGINVENLPKDWRWVEPDGEEDMTGHFVDGGDGDKRVEGRLVFRVEDFFSTAAYSEEGAGAVTIVGSLLPAA